MSQVYKLVRQVDEAIHKFYKKLPFNDRVPIPTFQTFEKFSVRNDFAMIYKTDYNLWENS